MDVPGPWHAIVATDDLRRDALGIDADDDGWAPVPVPGHWQRAEAFATNDAALLYRTRFSTPAPQDGQRLWVVFEGIYYQADVWLDGAYLGDPEGYFAPHAFDITDLARLTDDHVLAVEVSCAAQRNLAGKRNLTGVFQHHEFGGPIGNPGGIWRPVRIERTGPARLSALRVLCRDADEDRAHLRLRATLDSDASRQVKVRTRVDGRVVAERAHSLATGENGVAWDLDVSEHRLWWPWNLGDQHLTEVSVEVLVDGRHSDARTVSTGLREVALDHWQLSVNGERMFVLGANMAPTTMRLAEADPAMIRHDLELAKEAGLNMVRVQGHVGRPELYDEADRLGLLVWQDMPLQWGYARHVRAAAVRQAEALVDLLGHHPSIAVWCGHNEPMDVTTTRADLVGTSATRFVLAEQKPSWNEVLLDPWIKRAIERADETRPVLGYSGAVPRPPLFEGGDSHLWFGWYHGGDSRDVAALAAAVPRMTRFVSDLGAPAASDAAQAAAGRWDRADLAPFQAQVPRDRYPRPQAWVDATQQHQGELLQRSIETLRRLKYQPCGGVLFSALFDPVDEIGFGILDVHRRPKAAYQAVTEACRRVVVVADQPAATVHPGSMFALDVHLVNDERWPIEEAQCRATLRWPGGRHDWSYTGTAEPDGVARIATLQIVVPDVVGEMWLDLTVDYRGPEPAQTGLATNRYITQVVPAAM